MNECGWCGEQHDEVAQKKCDAERAEAESAEESMAASDRDAAFRELVRGSPGATSNRVFMQRYIRGLVST